MEKKEQLPEGSCFLYDRKCNFLSYKNAPLRMRTRAKSRVLPGGDRARRECAPGAHFFRTDSDIALMDGRIRGRGYEDSEGDQ